MQLEDLDLPREITTNRADARLGLLDDLNKDFLTERSASPSESHRTAYRRAVAMMRSTAIKAFDLDEEPAALRDAWPLPLPYAEVEPYDANLEETLFLLWQAGAVDLHVYDFPCQETVTDRPRATRLARYQAARSHFVTSVCHHLVELNQEDRALLMRLDGRRRRPLPRMEWFARMGLLEG